MKKSTPIHGNVTWKNHVVLVWKDGGMWWARIQAEVGGAFASAGPEMTQREAEQALCNWLDSLVNEQIKG